MTIQPFGFDRVFFHAEKHAPLGERASAVVDPLVAEQEAAERIAGLEAQIERMQADQAAQLARARADGFEAGLGQARIERGEALLAATDALHAGLDVIEARFEAMARRTAGDAAQVALYAAEMLAGHAIDAAPARAMDEALARVLEQVARGTALVVRGNPAMRDEIAALLARREADAGRALAITLVDDPAVPVGDARIEWQAGGLNVDGQARRAAVMEELAGVLA